MLKGRCCARGMTTYSKHACLRSALIVQYTWTAGTRVLSCDQVHECTCSNSMVSRYQPNPERVCRVSGPLLDRAEL